MRTLILLSLLLAVGCGPMWEGSYEGTLVGRATCTDGSTPTNAISASWDISEDGQESLTIRTLGTCSPLRASVTGNVAGLVPKNCPVFTDDTYIWQEVLSAGTLTLKEPSLDVSISGFIRFAFADGSMERCDERLTGTLRRTE